MSRVQGVCFAGEGQVAAFHLSGDKLHVGIAGVTLHKPRPLSIIEGTNSIPIMLPSAI